jgi:hypothetical protein
MTLSGSAVCALLPPSSSSLLVVAGFESGTDGSTET